MNNRLKRLPLTLICSAAEESVNTSGVVIQNESFESGYPGVAKAEYTFILPEDNAVSPGDFIEFESRRYLISSVKICRKVDGSISGFRCQC